ncbi:MAG: EF-P lysine aminoacylase GenX [Proteobacteria bacterium]|nr:EF-P lysine aminoacylase GenX [Pseudomonadota bacterium]
MLSLEGLHKRAAFFRYIRSFFHSLEFLEVDTPLRQPVYIPESNIVPISCEGQYLQSSPELSMKRLLASGCNRIFQLSHCFRKGELGRLHLEEFQLLEWYRTGCDYNQLMTDCEAFLRFLQEAMRNYATSCGDLNFTELFPGVDLSAQWQRLTVADAFAQYSPIPLARALEAGSFDAILTEYVEPCLGIEVPVFLYAYPHQLASLARKSPSNPTIAERFELYIKGIELANGFSELTDEHEQRHRFQKEIAAIHANYGREVVMPERFLQDLRNLEAAAGIALGVDRLFMLALNCKNITSSVTFAPEDFL